MKRLSRYDAGLSANDGGDSHKNKRHKSTAAAAAAPRAASSSLSPGLKKKKSLKNQLRSAQRALQHLSRSNNPEAATKLAQTAEQLAAEVERKRKQEKAELAEQKYAKIRFFECKKLERKLKSAQGEDAEKIKQDLLYIRHFPRGEKYVSVLTSEAEMSAKAIAQRARLRGMALEAAAKAPMRSETEMEEEDAMSHDQDNDDASEHDDDFFLPVN